MTMLHIIRSSGFTSNSLKQCLDMTFSTDSILLIDDGCYNLNHPLLREFLTKQPDFKVYIIEAHASARAQNIDSNSFITLAMAEMLELVFQHSNSITWS